MIESKDLKQVKKRLGALKYKAPDVMNRALNRAATNMRSNAVKKTREEYHIKAKTIRATMTIKKSTRASMGAAVLSTGNKEPITSYMVLPKSVAKSSSNKLVQVAVKKDDPKTLFHAFIIQRYGGGVYERRTSDRYPLRQIYGPSVPEILGNEDTRDFVTDEAWKMYEKRVDHEINRLLEARK